VEVWVLAPTVKSEVEMEEALVDKVGTGSGVADYKRHPREQ
jgi:hypothetical protein